MNSFTLIFTLDQVNELIACMATGPYARVHALIEDIKQQINAQVTPQKIPDAPRPGANGGAAP